MKKVLFLSVYIEDREEKWSHCILEAYSSYLFYQSEENVYVLCTYLGTGTSNSRLSYF